MTSDFPVKDVTDMSIKYAKIYCFPKDMVYVMTGIPHGLAPNPTVKNSIVYRRGV